MFRESSTPASFSIFSILSAIRFSAMLNLNREALRGGNQVRINRIKNMRFPEMQSHSILLISMAYSDTPLKLDSRKSQNPEYSMESHIPANKVNRKGVISASTNGLGSSSHPLKKLGSRKVGLGIILRSASEKAERFGNILFRQQVNGDFPKLLGSSVAIIITSGNKVDAPNPTSFHELFDSSSVNLNINVGIPKGMADNISSHEVPIQSGRNNYVCHEWPCVFSVYHSFDSVTETFLFPKPNGFPERQPLTICAKHRNSGYLTLKAIENSDNYTRRTDYLPYPKVTHMYNNCILEFRPRQLVHGIFNNPSYPPRVYNLRRWSLFNTNQNFLKKCETCDKSLEGIDVYIYRGESSFCSLECRYWKVMAEKEFVRITRMLPILPSSSSSKKAVFYVDEKPEAAGA